MDIPNVNPKNSEKSQGNKGSPSVAVQNRSLKKTSRLAIASIICVIFALLSLALDSAFFFKGSVFSILRIAALLFFAAAVALGVIALFVIHFRNKQLKGYRYAIVAIVLGATLGSLIFTGLFITWQVAEVRDERLRAKSGESNIRCLGRAIIEYAANHNDCLPIANQWCDLLMEYDKSISRNTFKNPQRLEGVCNFAFNKNLSGLRLADVPGKVVLFVETDGDWNANGGAELLDAKQQKRYMIALVLFVDGAVGEYWYSLSDIRFVEDKSDKYPYSPLRWNP